MISGSPPDFANFFQINFQNGVVTQIAPVSRTSAKEYNIIVRATEMPNVGKFAETNLVIKIKAEDLNPPVLTASDTIGKQTAENIYTMRINFTSLQFLFIFQDILKKIQ